MRGPGRPSRDAGRLSLVWRPRLDPGSQLRGANCASPGRQRTHMRVRNSQSGSANGPRRDCRTHSMMPSLPQQEICAHAPAFASIPSQTGSHHKPPHTVKPHPSRRLPSRERGQAEAGSIASRRRGRRLGSSGLRAAKHVGQTANLSVRTVAVAPGHICFGEGTFATASVGWRTRTFHLEWSGDTASETAHSATGHRSVPPLIRRGWRLCGC